MNFSSKAITFGIAMAGVTAFCAGATEQNTGEAIDPVFASGLATLKKVTGTVESMPDGPQIGWKPGLQLLIGVKAVEASRQTVGFVELTTLHPPKTNELGQPWRPALQTNSFYWSNTNGRYPVNREASFVSTLYPVKVRVFDQSGRKLKEGQTILPWGLLTNGLADVCRVSLEYSFHKKKKDAGDPDEKRSFRVEAGENRDSPEDTDKLAQSFGGGFIWLITMLRQVQTVPAVSDLWKKAHCSFRLPPVGTMVVGVFTGDFDLTVQPRLDELSVTDGDPGTNGSGAGQQYRLPVDLMSGNRNLTRAELVIGPASGAELLLGGIRSVRATHPTKPQQQFFVQVLSSGSVTEPHFNDDRRIR
jgi:hypothetical protein